MATSLETRSSQPLLVMSRCGERVDAVQIELKQRRYLLAADGDKGRPHPKRDEIPWQQTRRSFRAALEQLRRPFG